MCTNPPYVQHFHLVEYRRLLLTCLLPWPSGPLPSAPIFNLSMVIFMINGLQQFGDGGPNHPSSQTSATYPNFSPFAGIFSWVFFSFLVLPCSCDQCSTLVLPLPPSAQHALQQTPSPCKVFSISSLLYLISPWIHWLLLPKIPFQDRLYPKQTKSVGSHFSSGGIMGTICGCLMLWLLDQGC